MLIPKKTKFRKHFRGKMPGVDIRGSEINFGQFAIKSQDRGWLTSRQIEAARRAMTRYCKRGGKIWIRVFPDKVVSKTSDEVGMGGGKGGPDHFVAVVRPGRVIFELAGVDFATAKEAMRLAQHKLPILTKFMSKDEE